MKTSPRRKLLLALGGATLSLLLLEAGLRLLLEPSEYSYGTLLGHELPPFVVVPDHLPPPLDRAAPFRDLVVDGVPITNGDISGFNREDPSTGFAPRENEISQNGWWQSNSLGAQARFEAEPAIPPGLERILVFGDSFARGAGLPHQESWPTVLDAGASGAELLNFAVDGYGMGQAYLRFLEVRERLDYDTVLMMFVPGADLWRDINTMRDLGEDGWHLYHVLPRFVLVENQLVLIPGPYESRESLVESNRGHLSPELARHLAVHDRFYYPAKHQEPVLLSATVLGRMVTKVRVERRRARARESLIEPGSEAMRISRRIFEEMHGEVLRDGARLVVLLLPSPHELDRLRSDESFRSDWSSMRRFLCRPDLTCVDLASALVGLAEQEIDRSYDGGHYGPKVNHFIAEWLGSRLALSEGAERSRFR